MLRSKTGSALVTSSDPIIISQNGSPKGQASPAQSLLTLPTVDPPTNSCNLEPEVTSVLNGESDLKKNVISPVILLIWVLFQFILKK